MTMLPTDSPATVKRQVVFLECSANDLKEPQIMLIGTLNNATLVSMPANDIEPITVTAMDGFILCLDANQGLSAHATHLWQEAVDHNIPRCVLVRNIVGSRADFDEMTAIVRRVLEPDAIVRYLPIESDDESDVVGAFDILTNEIIQTNNGEIVRTPGDPEHLELTATAREDLLESLAHFFTDDLTLQRHTEGFPIKVQDLEDSFRSEDCVPVFFEHTSILNESFTQWIGTKTAHWEPTISRNGEVISISDLDDIVGIGVGSGLARLFGAIPSDTLTLQVRKSDGSVTYANVKDIQEGIALSASITFGDSVTLNDTGLTATLPEF